MLVAVEDPGDFPQRRVCSACGVVVGVYEPVICARGEHLVQTSCAADPDAVAGADAVYHADCALGAPTTAQPRTGGLRRRSGVSGA